MKVKMNLKAGGCKHWPFEKCNAFTGPDCRSGLICMSGPSGAGRCMIPGAEEKRGPS